jgi:isobutyryl-CoA mutase
MKKSLKGLSPEVPAQKPASPTTRTPRFITAASLFDGHDAAINVMRRILLSEGAEVIHLGHNRSVSEIVTAAIQEDAHAIAISSYQGGHVEFFKYVVDELKSLGASHIRVFGGGGGTITPDEARELEKYGVAKIYSPDDGRKLGLKGMISHMIEVTGQSPVPRPDIQDLKSSELAPAHPKALAQVLTSLEAGEKIPASVLSQPKQAMVVGLTGTGGAGKSSLTDELIVRLLEEDKKARIAVLAVDPTRRKTGGALLGDRLRMNSLKSSRVYMRSLATREANISISRATKDSVDFLSRVGFDWVFVETGGIGQADTSIVDLVDINVYVMTAEFGAPTQLEKINMLDYAHLVIINKFDKGGSLDAHTEVKKAFRRNHLEFEKLPPDRYPVFGTIASRFGDPGVDQAFRHLYKLKDVEQKLIPTEAAVEPDASRLFEIVPRSRTQYLADIVGNVHHYKEEVSKTVEKVAEWEALEEVLKHKKLSSSTRTELETVKAATEKTLPAELKKSLETFPEVQKLYKDDNFHYKVREETISVPLFHESLSKQKIRKVTPPHFRSKADLARFLMLENLPGGFPYTAGVFPFKRTEEDPKRQFAGEGTPTQTNTRFHLLCKGEKAKRLSTAFDSVTLYGHNPERRPDIYGKIGESGVSVCSLDDAKKLYHGFDLCDPTTSVSMTINGPAPMLLSFFFNTAIDQEIEKFELENKRKPTNEEWEKIKHSTLQRVRGTVQADILKEDQAQNTCIFSTEFALKMMGDIQQYFIDHKVRNYYSVSISGYHIAEAGANPISQLAFTLANGFTYVEYYLARGMKPDDFAANFSFFFSNGLDPEYTVLGRVARRIWAIAMRDRYGANERSQKLKYHIQTSGRSLHAQEISFNDIRTTLQALIAYFDNCNSLHTNAYDEAVTTPTAESVRRAMAIQLILSKEFGWGKNENPLQGSFFIEELTDLVEEAVLQEFQRLSARGGVLGAMETHYQRSKIQEESLYYEHLKHSGELPLIGVNTYLSPENSETIFPKHLTRASYAEKDEQIENLRKFHLKNEKLATAELANLKAQAKSGGNIFDALMRAGRVCSLGQLSHALYEIGGEYRRGV